MIPLQLSIDLNRPNSELRDYSRNYRKVLNILDSGLTISLEVPKALRSLRCAVSYADLAILRLINFMLIACLLEELWL
jgi:hypothetical protein